MNRIFVFLACLFALSGCLNDETNTQNGRNNGDFIGPHQIPDPETVSYTHLRAHET